MSVFAFVAVGGVEIQLSDTTLERLFRGGVSQQWKKGPSLMGCIPLQYRWVSELRIGTAHHILVKG